MDVCTIQSKSPNLALQSPALALLTTKDDKRKIEIVNALVKTSLSLFHAFDNVVKLLNELHYSLNGTNN